MKRRMILIAVLICVLIVAFITLGIFIYLYLNNRTQDKKSDTVQVDGDIFNNPNAIMLGGTVCDYLYQQVWGGGFKGMEPLKVLKENGMNWVRVGVEINDCPILDQTPYEKWGEMPCPGNAWSSKEYAKRILLDAGEAGLMKNLFFFLSDTAASGAEQNAPAVWQEHSAEEMADALEKYCYETTKYYADAGIKIDLYDLGNENERGILNFRPDERIERPSNVNVLVDTEWMRENVWKIQAELFKACIRGIKKADPDAKINIHASCFGMSENILVLGFFKAMADFGVDYDVCGVSYYWNTIDMDCVSPLSPKTAYWKTESMESFLTEIKKLGKLFIFSEIQYPYDNEIVSPDAAPDEEYPFSPEGQASWIRDFLEFCDSRPEISGSIYFYPDYFPNMSSFQTLNACGLFNINREANSALLEYNKFAQMWREKYK